MTHREPQKQRKLFEHQAPWLVLTVLGVLMSCALSGGLVSGVFGQRSAFRGYAPWNVTLAVIAMVLFTISGFYLLRKRLFQEEFSWLRASMQSWLWAHIYLSLFGGWLILIHAGYSLMTLELTSGKLALFALAASLFSGFVWRLVYAVVPKRAAQSVGSYSGAASRREAEQLAVEIEKLAAGRSPQFRALKQRFTESFVTAQELERALAGIPHDEQPSFRQLYELGRRWREAGTRGYKQRAFVRLLQSWRVLHVPLTLLFLVAVPVHVVLAYRLPARVTPPGTVEGNSLGRFEAAEACANCHARIVEQWQGSLHAQAMWRTTMIAQTNQDLKTTLKDSQGPDPKDLCINCHGPVGAALTRESQLPLRSPGALAQDQDLLNDGISCVVCHQYQGKSFPGHAALSSFQEGYGPPRHYYGPRSDPVPNSFHKSSSSPLFEKPEEICQNCHSVNYDLNKDGKIVKAEDLVLQTIFEEWQYYRKRGGTATCVDCHMPIGTEERAADAAWIPFEQDYQAPKRQVRDHTFIGADHRLDITEAEDPHATARRKLLQSAASLTLDAQSVKRDATGLSFNVVVTNLGAGHRLPGGFAFQRQLWIEASVLDSEGRVIRSSGQVPSPEHDLCDTGMFTGVSKSVLPFTLGCNEPDPLLINFQTILLDHIEGEKTPDSKPVFDELGDPKLAATKDAKETFLQHFSGGAISRTRGVDGKATPPLDPGEERTLNYRFELGSDRARADRIRVRLLFRAFAPYFLRALGENQPPTEANVAPLVKNLRIDELAQANLAIPKEAAGGAVADPAATN